MNHDKKHAPRPARCAADGIGFRMAKELHAFGITGYADPFYSGTARPLLDDARPVEDRPELVEVAWRPVVEYGTGPGEGFTKEWELMAAAHALSTLREAIERDRLDVDERAAWSSTGATLAMIDDARQAADRAHVLWLRATGRQISWSRTTGGQDYPEDTAAAEAIAATDDASRS